MKYKIFDVVELNNGKKANIIEINKEGYKAEIIDNIGISYGFDMIKEKDITRVIFSR